MEAKCFALHSLQRSITFCGRGHLRTLNTGLFCTLMFIVCAPLSLQVFFFSACVFFFPLVVALILHRSLVYFSAALQNYREISWRYSDVILKRPLERAKYLQKRLIEAISAHKRSRSGCGRAYCLFHIKAVIIVLSMEKRESYNLPIMCKEWLYSQSKLECVG